MVATTKFDFEEYVASKRMLVDAHLAEYLATGSPEVLWESMRYSVLSPGKRIRALLCLASAQAVKEDAHLVALPTACAIEMIHTASLIHSDLPSINNTALRRGKAPLHTLISDGQALLAGSYLTTHAFHVLATATDLTAKQRIALTEILASRSGGYGLMGGTMLDLLSDGQRLELDTLEMLHALKTGALITASLEFGGVLAEADETTLAALQTIGEAIGLAYQINEDISDITQHCLLPSEEEEEEGRLNYVALMGVEQAKETATSLRLTAEEAIESLPGEPTLLLQLAQMMTTRERQG
jgi:geranylgeranyl diphosphate synthase type II